MSYCNHSLMGGGQKNIWSLSTGSVARRNSKHDITANVTRKECNYMQYYNIGEQQETVALFVPFTCNC